jgi:hypothetical protein
MTRHNFIVFLLICSTLSVVGQDCNKDNAKAFISGLFEKGQYISYDSTRFLGYSKEMTPVKTPTLNKLLPGYCFFSTFFYSYNFEYSRVETAIALSKSKNTKSKLVHSPVYTDTPDDFISLFRGIKTSDTTERITLAKDITNIFTAITYKGHIGGLLNLNQKDIVSFELWHDDLSWRIYNFYFGSDGRLNQIKIDNGLGVKK